MKALKFIPIVINQTNRPEYTEVRPQENILSDALLAIGNITLHVRTWFYQPSFINQERRFQKRYECYFDGQLISYSTDRNSILKEAKWLSSIQ